MNPVGRIFPEPLAERPGITTHQVRPAARGKDKEILHGISTFVDLSYFLYREPSIALGIFRTREGLERKFLWL
jgi:hypothetical protein